MHDAIGVGEDTYLGLDVIKGRRADNGEADEEDVGLGVGQRSEPVIILLACGIPEPQTDGLPINHHAGGVVVEPAASPSLVFVPMPVVARRRGEGKGSSRHEHSRDVFAGEGVSGVRDEKTCLPRRHRLVPRQVRVSRGSLFDSPCRQHRHRSPRTAQKVVSTSTVMISNWRQARCACLAQGATTYLEGLHAGLSHFVMGIPGGRLYFVRHGC